MASWGDPQERFVGHEEPQLGCAVAAPHGDPAREPEVAVEPRVPQHPAVDLDAELAEADRSGVGPGPHPEVGRVGVGPDDPEAPGRRAAGVGGPRHHAAAPHHDETPWSGRPRARFVDHLEPARGQPADHLGGRVEGRGGGRHEAAEVEGDLLRWCRCRLAGRARCRRRLRGHGDRPYRRSRPGRDPASGMAGTEPIRVVSAAPRRGQRRPRDRGRTPVCTRSGSISSVFGRSSSVGVRFPV